MHSTLGYVLRIFKNDEMINEILMKAESNINYGYHSVLKIAPIENF